MAKLIYTVPEGARGRAHVKIEATNGEELTEAQALIVVLNQIDDRLIDLAAALESR